MTIRNYIPKNTLSSKIWKNNKMKPEVREKLLDIAENFIEDLGISLDYDDITMTGSLSNYNYTPFSDIDLHIVFDFDEVIDIDNEVLVKEFFNTKKNYWNKVHDVEIKGIEVEIYPQDSKEKHVSTGVYSVLKDEWIVEPRKFKNTIDKESIKSKFRKVEREIKFTLSDAKKESDYSVIDKFIDKLKKMRKSGLSAYGELADENIVYKIIRDKGYLQKLFDTKNKLIDLELSI